MLRMLLVDDQDLEREGIRYLIETLKLPLDVTEARNGKEALEILNHQSDFDVLFTDIKMPVMDGLQLCTSARALYPELTIVICSAYDEFEYARKAISLGVSCYLLRPVSMDDFKKTMDSVIKMLDTRQNSKKEISDIEETGNHLSPRHVAEQGSTLAQLRAPYQRDNYLHEVMSYLHFHYGEDISIDDIAKSIHVSSGHLSREFKRETGMSLMQFFQQYRLKKAQEMLLNTDAKIHEIAKKTGFKSSTYLGIVFKKYFHLTPNEYRVQRGLLSDEQAALPLQQSFLSQEDHSDLCDYDDDSNHNHLLDSGQTIVRSSSTANLDKRSRSDQ